MKKIVRLTESDLHRIIKESVKRVLKEDDYDLPTGGFDGYAYRYDQAIKNAASIEDWNRMMADRDKSANLGAKLAQKYHPGSNNNGSLRSFDYVHPYPVTSYDETLDDIEKDSKRDREIYGYPL